MRIIIFGSHHISRLVSRLPTTFHLLGPLLILNSTKMLAIFEGLEDMIKKISDISDCSRALVTLASAVGILVFFLYSLYFSYQLIQMLRLYVLSQFCCKVNFVKKYGQWAVITGATDGIGLGLAKELARRGMSIIVVSRNEEKLARTKAILEQEPNVGDVETIKIDMSDSSLENFENIRAQIDPENRDIGLLINNAGTFPARYARYCRFDTSEIVSLVNLNIIGTLLMTRMILPGMVQRGKGMVMNVSSVVGSMPAPYFNVYGASKSFMDSYTRQLQMEYSSHPIDIILLQPGPVCTKLLKATSKLSDPSLLIPSPDDYAKTVINALSTGVNEFTGNLIHQFIKNQGVLLYKLNILHLTMKTAAMINGRHNELSPVTKRKLVVAVPAQGAGDTDAPTGVSATGFGLAK